MHILQLDVCFVQFMNQFIQFLFQFTRKELIFHEYTKFASEIIERKQPSDVSYYKKIVFFSSNYVEYVCRFVLLVIFMKINQGC